MRRSIVLIGATVAMLLLSKVASGRIWYVHPTGTINSIQAGLDSCSNGDTVAVAAFTYYENITWPNTQSICLVSIAGPDTTVIDGGGTASVITINTDVDSTTRITGFTIRNGLASGDWPANCGGGIHCYYSSPTITDNTIIDNTASLWGGGIYCDDSPAIIRNNIIAHNTAGWGGAIYCDQCSPKITGNTITYNTAKTSGGGIYCQDHSSPTIMGNTIDSDTATYSGGGIACSYFSSPTITSNTITSNKADAVGGGIYCYYSSSPVIAHNTINGNICSNSGGGIHCYDHSSPTIDSCVISDNDGDGVYCGDRSSPVIHYSTIANNTGYGVRNVDSRDTVDARYNWWGAGSGPGGVGPGNGDEVSEWVYYEPWLTPPSPPALVTPTNNSAINDVTPRFVWQDTSTNLTDVDYYILQYAIDTLFTLEAEIVDSIFDTTYTVPDTLALSDTTYYWHVKAVDLATSEGDWSAIWNFELDTRLPLTPTLLSPVGGDWLNHTTVAFEWTEVTFSSKASETRYVLEVDTTLLFTKPVGMDTVAIPYDTLMLAEGHHYWRVKAFDLAGNQGDFSSPDSFGVDITGPIFYQTTVLTDTILKGPYDVNSIITDALSGVDSVFLCYRFDEGKWDSLPMEILTDSLYQAQIPEVSDTNTTINYYLYARDFATNTATDPVGAPDSVYSFVGLWVGIAEQKPTVPTTFGLYQNYPNPFVSKTTIRFALPKESRVSLNIYDMSGRLVATLVSEKLKAGYHAINWYSDNLPSGVYFYKIQARSSLGTGDYTEIKKAILSR